MSQRDLVAELRAARVDAPPEVRERIRLLAAAAPRPPRRLTWRRSLALAVPVAAAIAAAVVFTRPSSDGPRAVPVLRAAVTHGAAPGAAPDAARSDKSLTIPSSRARVQTVAESLELRVEDVSGAVKRAVRVVTALGGHATSVHASTHGSAGTADLTLKVPRGNLQVAMSRLAQLGTIRSERLEVTDREAALGAADRLIARLQDQLAVLRAQQAAAAQIAALTHRIESLQRAQAATRRAAHFATISLQLATPVHAAAKKSATGPLHGVVVALEWLGIGAVYALAIGAPVGAVLTLLWLAGRLVRRRRVDALLSRN